MSDTRSHENVIEIEAAPSAVWKALTEAEQIVAWFATDARVDPREGGEYWVAWGAVEGPGAIVSWEPERHLQVRAVGGTTPRWVDYHLEAGGGSTVLRIVHSGFGAGDSFDMEFESTRKGWGVFMRNLRHYVEGHAGEPAAQRNIYAELTGTREDAWRTLMTEVLGGFDATAGESYATGVFSGTVLDLDPPFAIGLTARELGDGIVRLMIESMGGGVYLYAQLIAIGSGVAALDGVADHMETSLTRAFADA